MPQVMKGNRQLTINEEKVEEFLSMGYSLIDGKGNVTKAGSAVTFKDLKLENETLKAELAKVQEVADNNSNSEELDAIKAENAALKTENEALKAENEALKTENTAVKAENETLKKEAKKQAKAE